MESQGKTRKVEITKKNIEIWADSNFTGKTIIEWHEGTPNGWEEIKHVRTGDLDLAFGNRSRLIPNRNAGR